mgnify:CR=1 FL=1
MISNYGDFMEELKEICEKEGTLDNFKSVAHNLFDTKYYDFRWPHGESLLHWAAGSGNDEICKYLLDLGSYINAENIYGCNPLFYASLKEKFSTVKLLLENGANFESKSVFSGGTPYNPSNLNLSASNNFSENRMAIMNLIKNYQITKENLCQKSLAFDSFIKANTKKRDLWEFEFRKHESQYGNKTSQGYWGLPNDEVYQKFNEIKNNDLEILFILNNPTKWCYNCCKINISALRCSKCKQVYYCSIECQKKDYKNHKKLCNNF